MLSNMERSSRPIIRYRKMTQLPPTRAKVDFDTTPSEACYTSSMIEIKTGHKEWDGFWPIAKSFIDSNRVEIETNGATVKGYHAPDCSWLWFRDCVHCMEITTFLDPEIKSSMDWMLKTQRDDGSHFDFLKQDGTMMRITAEADLEYIAAIGVYRAWLAFRRQRMDAFVPAVYPGGLNYIRTHPWRWDETQGFPNARTRSIPGISISARASPKCPWPGIIDEKTHFGIMHGDVHGLYYAYRVMEAMLDHIGDKEKALDIPSCAKSFVSVQINFCGMDSFTVTDFRLTAIAFRAWMRSGSCCFRILSTLTAALPRTKWHARSLKNIWIDARKPTRLPNGSVSIRRFPREFSAMKTQARGSVCERWDNAAGRGTARQNRF